MSLVPVQIPPGMFRAGTEYQSRGRWYSGSLVRFFSGTVQPVGGWYKVNSVALTGRPCALLGWTPDASAVGSYLAVGTNSNAYVYDGDAAYDITPAGFTSGTSLASNTLGYGGGLYGAGDYGTARTGTGGITPMDTWHFDTWGEYLVGVFTADGRLLEWQLNTSNDFAVISNAPTNCTALVVTAERILMALGAGGDRRKIAWSDFEDNTNWTASTTSAAGDLLLTTEGRIVTGERVRGGTLIHTDTDCHLSSYIGSPFYYNVEKIADHCGIASAHAKISFGSAVVWMGVNGFFTYDGYVRPLPCEVNDYVFSGLNKTQRSKVAAWHNGEWGEIWWFYPADASDENNRYVVWNYRENHWTLGELARSAGIPSGAWDYPICADPSGYWYYHETGYTDDGTERGSSVFLESGPLEIAPGQQMTWVNQVIHDESDSVDSLSMTIKTRFTPEGDEYTAGPYTLNASTGYTDVRANGRAYKLRFEESTSGAWKLGTLRMDIRAGGRR